MCGAAGDQIKLEKSSGKLVVYEVAIMTYGKNKETIHDIVKNRRFVCSRTPNNLQNAEERSVKSVQ